MMSRIVRAFVAVLPLAGPITIGLQPVQAFAQERCSGTVCDLFYKNSPAPTATTQPVTAPAGATPMTVPSSGGILGFFKSGSSDQAAGAAQTTDTRTVKIVGGHPADEPCAGTICDFYHKMTGSSSAQATPQAASPSAQGALLPAGTPVDARQARNENRDYVEPVREAKQCHSATDPWHCYRR